MHPQLSDKTIVCKEFIRALELCHSSNWARLTGGCNGQKNKLNTCLRKERLDRSSENRKAAKDKRAQLEQIWREFHEDD